MIISSLLRRSYTHEVCEDALLCMYADNNSLVGGVFDGCSSGKDSVWASNTLKHLFAKFDSYDFMADLYIAGVIKDFSTLATLLKLAPNNLESTAILFQYMPQSKTLLVRPFGDGSIFVNGERIDFDENNTPDYLGHYVNSDPKELEYYFRRHPVEVFENVEHFSICSDGIDKIAVSNLSATATKKDSAILFDPIDSPNHLERRWNILKKDGWIVNDDLSIISVNNGDSTVQLPAI